MVAYLAQATDKTAVAKLTGIAWRTVGRIVERIVVERLDPNRFQGLRHIGIDEFSYRKRHRYITVVLDHDSRRVVWAGEGRSAQALDGFFALLGPDGRDGIELVTIDMAGAYEKAVRENLPNALVIYDRFHVQRLASDAVDAVRREIVRGLAGTPEARRVKGTRYALLKNPWELTLAEKQRLRDVQANNAKLYRAYLLKETLAAALSYVQPKRARQALDAWLSWASRSKLEPFVRVARTIRSRKQGILAYVKYRLTNGVVEGTNNRLRTIARRAYGFHSAGALISMLFLCCGGVELHPPLPS